MNRRKFLANIIPAVSGVLFGGYLIAGTNKSEDDFRAAMKRIWEDSEEPDYIATSGYAQIGGNPATTDTVTVTTSTNGEWYAANPDKLTYTKWLTPNASR